MCIDSNYLDRKYKMYETQEYPGCADLNYLFNEYQMLEISQGVGTCVYYKHKNYNYVIIPNSFNIKI